MSPRSISDRTLLKHIKSMQLYVSNLRKQLYPILGRWSYHKLTRADNEFGFARLNLLREELDKVEGKLRKASKTKFAR